MLEAELRKMFGVDGCAGVRHVDLDIQDAPQGCDDGMIVLWRGGLPVGHLLRASDGECRITPIATAQDASLTAPVLDLPSASVVICTRDRPNELRRCLASLPRQTFLPEEVIVVDNASRGSETREVALAAGAIYVREDRPGLDIARNRGALRASSEIVAYTDDDVLLHPQWLERLVTAFDSPSIGAVTGLVLPAEIATEAQRYFETFWSFGQGYTSQIFRAADFAASRHEVFPAWKVGAGASMAFRRDVFDRAGLFDERLDVGQAGCSGDSEYWYRLLANGYDCRYQPTSVAFHFHRRTMEGLAKQIYFYMRGHAAALLVQYERTGVKANLRQVLKWKPLWYLGRVRRRLLGRRVPEDHFLWQEIAGYASGILFYLRTRRG
ncbi:glycosyltransferase family 2 protein [Mesorhizobium sp. SARCC-RB16n]|uniref:glycosyltransferase family 2 protein n=1 Tax=Mesorhizobium sp. SARCC-RB16n TaxID=2116687 RepID=UPI001FEE5399|nr:glycosyltransferase [Mesorhizobium sp. SARCC-RB16n]